MIIDCSIDEFLNTMKSDCLVYNKYIYLQPEY